MRAKVKNITAYLEKLAPASIALPGDSIGLQVGSLEAPVDKILVALDPDRPALEEAMEIGASLIVGHHPLFYESLASVDESDPRGRLIAEAIRAEISIITAHSNYDAALNGVSHHLAEALGLHAGKVEVLEVTGKEQLMKLVVFVPEGYEDQVREALAGAGAGQIGSYSHCTFQVRGTGTFKPGDAGNPFIGSPGQLEKVGEWRLETILPAARRRSVIASLLSAHPYEEVAYDFYPLDLEGRSVGLGLLAELDQPVTTGEIIKRCKSLSPAGGIRVSANVRQQYTRVALCGGSGGSLLDKASICGAEIFISGDFRYHDYLFAREAGITLVDAGHGSTEWPAVRYLQTYLAECLCKDGFRTETRLQAATQPLWEQHGGN